MNTRYSKTPQWNISAMKRANRKDPTCFPLITITCCAMLQLNDDCMEPGYKHRNRVPFFPRAIERIREKGTVFSRLENPARIALASLTVEGLGEGESDSKNLSPSRTVNFSANRTTLFALGAVLIRIWKRRAFHTARWKPEKRGWKYFGPPPRLTKDVSRFLRSSPTTLPFAVPPSMHAISSEVVASLLKL